MSRTEYIVTCLAVLSKDLLSWEECAGGGVCICRVAREGPDEVEEPDEENAA